MLGIELEQDLREFSVRLGGRGPLATRTRHTTGRTASPP